MRLHEKRVNLGLKKAKVIFAERLSSAMTAVGAERAVRNTIRDNCGHSLQRLVRLMFFFRKPRSYRKLQLPVHHGRYIRKLKYASPPIYHQLQNNN